MTGPAIGIDPERDLPRPVQMSFTTDTEVEAAVVAIEKRYRDAGVEGVSRSTILHRVVRRALVGEPVSRE